MTSDSDELTRARERFADDLDDMRGSLQEELGWAPRGLRWIVPIVALATGIFAGVAVKRNLPRLRRGGSSPTQPRRRR